MLDFIKRFKFLTAGAAFFGVFLSAEAQTNFRGRATGQEIDRLSYGSDPVGYVYPQRVLVPDSDKNLLGFGTLSANLLTASNVISGPWNVNSAFSTIQNNINLINANISIIESNFGRANFNFIAISNDFRYLETYLNGGLFSNSITGVTTGWSTYAAWGTNTIVPGQPDPFNSVALLPALRTNFYFQAYNGGVMNYNFDLTALMFEGIRTAFNATNPSVQPYIAPLYTNYQRAVDFTIPIASFGGFTFPNVFQLLYTNLFYISNLTEIATSDNRVQDGILTFHDLRLDGVEGAVLVIDEIRDDLAILTTGAVATLQNNFSIINQNFGAISNDFRQYYTDFMGVWPPTANNYGYTPTSILGVLEANRNLTVTNFGITKTNFVALNQNFTIVSNAIFGLYRSLWTNAGNTAASFPSAQMASNVAFLRMQTNLNLAYGPIPGITAPTFPNLFTPVNTNIESVRARTVAITNFLTGTNASSLAYYRPSAAFYFPLYILNYGFMQGLDPAYPGQRFFNGYSYEPETYWPWRTTPSPSVDPFVLDYEFARIYPGAPGLNSYVKYYQHGSRRYTTGPAPSQHYARVISGNSTSTNAVSPGAITDSGLPGGGVAQNLTYLSYNRSGDGIEIRKAGGYIITVTITDPRIDPAVKRLAITNTQFTALNYLGTFGVPETYITTAKRSNILNIAENKSPQQVNPGINLEFRSRRDLNNANNELIGAWAMGALGTDSRPGSLGDEKYLQITTYPPFGHAANTFTFTTFVSVFADPNKTRDDGTPSDARRSSLADGTLTVVNSSTPSPFYLYMSMGSGGNYYTPFNSGGFRGFPLRASGFHVTLQPVYFESLINIPGS
jgi:hypothetical protein